METTLIVKKRPRIARGQLVASTNPIKIGCIKRLTIAHYYKPLSFKRVKQLVVHQLEDLATI